MGMVEINAARRVVRDGRMAERRQTAAAAILELAAEISWQHAGQGFVESMDHAVALAVASVFSYGIGDADGLTIATGHSVVERAARML